MAIKNMDGIGFRISFSRITDDDSVIVYARFIEPRAICVYKYRPVNGRDAVLSNPILKTRRVD